MTSLAVAPRRRRFWVLLFVAQSTLISGGKVALHRRLGVAGAALAALLGAVGTATAIAAISCTGLWLGFARWLT